MGLLGLSLAVSPLFIRYGLKVKSPWVPIAAHVGAICAWYLGKEDSRVASELEDLIESDRTWSHESKLMGMYDHYFPQSNKVQSVSAEVLTEVIDTQILPTGADQAASLGRTLIETLNSFNQKTDWIGAAIAPSFIRLKIKPQAGVKISAIEGLSKDLKVALGINEIPVIMPEAGYLAIDMPRQDRQTPAFENYIQKQSFKSDKITIPVGINIEGKLIEASLSDPNTCHFLVGGTTGSGKSEFLRSLLAGLLVRYSPDILKVVLVDPKRVTFPEFEDCQWLYEPIARDVEIALEVIQKLTEEMDSRYKSFESAGVSDLDKYNQKSSKSLARIVCIFDEYADFMADKNNKQSFEQSIKRLGAMARAAGIHLIIATQRPEKEIVTPLIRSNLPGRVALKVASQGDSMIVLGGDDTTAAQLLGKGDLFFLAGSKKERLQALLITQESTLSNLPRRVKAECIDTPSDTPYTESVHDTPNVVHRLESLLSLDYTPNTLDTPCTDPVYDQTEFDAFSPEITPAELYRVSTLVSEGMSQEEILKQAYKAAKSAKSKRYKIARRRFREILHIQGLELPGKPWGEDEQDLIELRELCSI